MTFAFNIPLPVQPKSTDAGPLAALVNEGEEAADRQVLPLASRQFVDEYAFTRMGGWNVTLRSSIIRITFFKLLGTGLAAAFMTVSPHIGAYTAWSLSLSAAVNFVACGHYWYIWAVRNQTYRLPKYDKFMSEVGRAPAEKVALVDKQEEDDKSRIYFQEITVDGLRHSDWLCTLVLMSLDFGHLRQYLNYATAGVIPDMPIKKHWVASLQALMILFASIWRFYLNEGRTYLGTDRKPRELHPCVIGVAWGSLAVSCGIFGVVVWALLDGLPDWSDTFPEHINTDVTCMRVLVLIWVGYPIVAILPRIGHEQLDLPGFEYNAAWSFFKDLGFAFLDVASKAGLAIYFVLKASWVDAATENALVAAGKIALNVTV